MDNTPLAEAIRALLYDALGDKVEAAVQSALTNTLPEVIRRAALPIYLSKPQLMELTGWSSRKVDYMRAERRIPFLRHGRTVLFPTRDVEEYLRQGYVAPNEAATRVAGGRRDG